MSALARSESSTALPPTASASRSARERPAGAGDRGAVRRRSPRCQASHRAGPDDEHPPAVEAAQLSGEEPVGSAHQRTTGRADPGLAMDPLAHSNRSLEQGVEHRPDSFMRLGKGQGALHPPENLVIPITSESSPTPTRTRERPRLRQRTQHSDAFAAAASDGENLGRVIQCVRNRETEA